MAEAKKTPKKTENDVFGKMKGHFDPKKVDTWQETWLQVPSNRKKYEKLADAPEVVGEEMTAIVSDIIDFAQGQEGGKSHLFDKVRSGFKGVAGKAKGAAMAGAAQAKGAADAAKNKAESAAKDAKAQADKAAGAAKKAGGKAAGTAKKAAKK